MFFKIGVLKNFAILKNLFLIMLQAFFYKAPMVTDFKFCGSKYFFAADYGTH